MSSPTAPPVMPELSNRVRRLIYQASYTGMKETDLLLGHFAKMHLPHLNESDLTDFENLLEAGDPAIYACCLLYTSPSPRDRTRSRMPSSA